MNAALPPDHRRSARKKTVVQGLFGQEALSFLIDKPSAITDDLIYNRLLYFFLYETRGGQTMPVIP